MGWSNLLHLKDTKLNIFNKIAGLILILVCLLASTGLATAKTWPGRQEKVLGIAGKVTFPFAGFGDKVNTGYGVAGIVDYPLIPFLDLTADVGYNHFSEGNSGAGADIWSLTFGGRFVLGSFFMGGETGYFSQADEWSYVPSVGLRFGKFEGAIRYKGVSGVNWTSVRLGYYF